MLRSVRQYLEQSGYRVRLGLAWPWIHEVPVVANAPWDFLAMSESPAFTSAELERSSRAAAVPGAPRWITLRPLPKLQYAVDQRARDLVLRMLAAKTRGIAVIFASDPFDDSLGLVNRDGTPSELFLPWCITADLVGGAEYLGSIPLPQGSHNSVFVRNGEAVMAVWNENPVSETLYLGDQVRQLDLWGRECSLSLSESSATTTQTFTAGPLPTFLTGLHLAVASLAGELRTRAKSVGECVWNQASRSAAVSKHVPAQCQRLCHTPRARHVGSPRGQVFFPVGGQRITGRATRSRTSGGCVHRPATCANRFRGRGRSTVQIQHLS